MNSLLIPLLLQITKLSYSSQQEHRHSKPVSAYLSRKPWYDKVFPFSKHPLAKSLSECRFRDELHIERSDYTKTNSVRNTFHLYSIRPTRSLRGQSGGDIKYANRRFCDSVSGGSLKVSPGGSGTRPEVSEGKNTRRNLQFRVSNITRRVFNSPVSLSGRSGSRSHCSTERTVVVYGALSREHR